MAEGGGARILAFRGRRPRLHEDAWVAPGATLIGDVDIGAGSSVWFGSVVRGDFHWIRVGAGTNLQDHCVVHVTRERFPAQVGDEVTVGHRATVHGCRVGDGALVGIGAVVLDGAVIGEEALVAAGALVTPGTRVAPRTLVMGTPARPVRELSAGEVDAQRIQARAYARDARVYAEEEGA